MESRSRKPAIESLETRNLLSTTAVADFNNDGLNDVAAIAGPNTITVSLAQPDGSYVVSATLTTPKTEPILDLSVSDRDGDGRLDISASAVKGSAWNLYSWLGQGDGTFGSPTTSRWKPPKNAWF